MSSNVSQVAKVTQTPRDVHAILTGYALLLSSDLDARIFAFPTSHAPVVQFPEMSQVDVHSKAFTV